MQYPTRTTPLDRPALVRTAALALTGGALAGLTLMGVALAGQPSTAHDGDSARALIGQLMTTLQAELTGAMQAGGPVNAVGFCQTRAPAIATEVSAASGWQVGRTSLKPRNPANAPDAWEAGVLAQFQSRKDNGEPVAGMRYAEVVNTDTGPAYRYMQAIPTGEVCLACHGTELAPELAEAIDKAYPQDQARGYAAGDIRGAFTLQRPL